MFQKNLISLVGLFVQRRIGGCVLVPLTALAFALLLLVGPMFRGGAHNTTSLGEAKLWNIGTNDLDATLLEIQGAVRCVAFSLDGKIVATGDTFGGIKLWDADTKTLIRHIKMPGTMSHLVFLPDRKSLTYLQHHEVVSE